MFVNGEDSSTSSENEKRSCCSSEMSATERCSVHPDCTRAIEYCKDCQRQICSECRRNSDAAVNHSEHSTVSLESAIDEAERCADAAGALLLRVAFAAADAERCAAAARELDARHTVSLAHTSEELLERAAEKLAKLRNRALSSIKIAPTSPESDWSTQDTAAEAPDLWTPAEAKRQSESLRRLIEASKGDSKATLEKHEEVRRLSEELQRWLDVGCSKHREIHLPTNAEAALRQSICKMMFHIEEAERELENAANVSMAIRKPIAEIRLLESFSVAEGELQATESDAADLRVLGIAAGHSPDTFLFVDANNGKIKMIDTKTCHCSLV